MSDTHKHNMTPPKMYAPPKFVDADVRRVFESTAQLVDVVLLQACVASGEPQVIKRAALYEYLGEYGGACGEAVQCWVQNFEGTLIELESELNRIGVPATW